MKKILIIILCLGIFTLSGCDELEKEQKRIDNFEENSIMVEDDFGHEYRIVTIEGCKYYRWDEYRQFGLSKVNCDCVPDTTGR